MRFVWLAFAAFVAALFVVNPASALDVPKLEGRVNDLADMLSADAEDRIERTLEAHEKATGQQFAVLTIKSLEGDDLKAFSMRTAEAWKLGRKKKDDGLLLLVVKDDRMINIEVGYGLEPTITDALTSRIIRGIIEPAFKAGEYAAGIEGAMNELVRHESANNPAPPPPPVPARRKDGPSLLSLLVLLLIFGPFLLRLFGGGGGMGGGFGRRGRFGGFYGGSWGGFGGGGFSSGGFGGGGFGGGGGGGFSGGGGGFGGGGASGRW